MAEYPLPPSYRTPLSDGWVQEAARNPNFALILQKVQPWRKNHGVWAILGDEDSGKSNWLRSLEAHGQFPDQELFRAFVARWARTVNSSVAQTMNLTTASRLVVGFGSESTLENGIVLHRPTGLPIIPGSALKGLCRMVCLASVAAELGIEPVPIETAYAELKSEKGSLDTAGWHTLAVLLQGTAKDQRSALKALQDTANAGKLSDLDAFNSQPSVGLFRQMFGEMGQAGHLIFFDAIPMQTTRRLFAADVLTPHFSEYYTSNSAPNDDLRPLPNVFLTVPEGITFRFAVGVRPGKDTKPAGIALSWLKYALIEMGIGAKTAAGYGRFIVP